MRAKPAVPLAGEPLVRRILRYVARAGVREAVLNLHYLPETITRQVGDGRDLNLQVRYSFESPILGSAGGPRRALALLPDADFFIINGDTLTDVDLGALAESHQSSGALATIAVTENRWPDRYGGLVVDATGRFHSAVPRGSHVRSYHMLGVQMARPSAFAGLDPDVPVESIRGVYPQLVAKDPGAVRAFLCEADFCDVGTAADYFEASAAIGRREQRPFPHTGTASQIDPEAVVTDTILWDHVTVSAGASLDHCIVGDGVTVPAGARFENCIIIQINGELAVDRLWPGR